MRFIVLTLALVAGFTPAAVAQGVTVDPRGSIAPFVGYSLGYSTSGDMVVSASGFGSWPGTFEQDGAGGIMFGVDAQYMVHEMVAVSGVLAFGSWGETTTTFRSGGTSEISRSPEGLGLVMIRGGVNIHLPNFPIVLSAAPGIVRIDQKDPDTPRAFRDPINHWIFVLGMAFEMSIPGTRFGGFLGAEDMIVRWNTREMEKRYDRAFAEETGVNTTTSLEASASHSVAVRLGLRFTF